MREVHVHDVGGKLQDLVEEVTAGHQPVQITSDTGSAMLVDERDWRALQERLMRMPSISYVPRYLQAEARLDDGSVE